MNRDKKIDYVEFNATDLAKTKAFYNAVFGWNFVDYGPEYTSFSDGRIEGGFRKGEVASGATTLIVIFVDDLALTEKAVRANGGTITKQVFSFPGGSRFHFTDPNGNELAAWLEDSK